MYFICPITAAATGHSSEPILAAGEHGEGSRSQMKVSTNGFSGAVKPLEKSREII
jgi:hypothetical protein